MPHEVKIENASSRHILVTSVRWLETEEEKWLDQPFEKLVIAPGDSWNGLVEMTDLRQTETFVTANYQILDSGSLEPISETKRGPQRHVADCTKPTSSYIKIVDLR